MPEEPLAVSMAKKLRDAYNNFQAGKPQTLDLFTDDIVYCDPRFPAVEGKKALEEYLQRLAGENEALQVSWEYTNIISEGDQAAVEWLVQSGLDFGGRKFEFAGAAFFEVRNGKICYYRGYWDTAVLQQLTEQ